jgi:protein with PEP-CTERM/exosortase system signal
MNTTIASNIHCTATRFIIPIVLLMAITPAVTANLVFSNDFESNTNGFTASGSLSSLSRVSLPTDSGGLASPNQSMWLGELGAGIPKSGSQDEIVTAHVFGLTPGQSYKIAFDLFIGASWDGSAVSFGPDSWRLAVDGNRLVDTTFSNLQQGIDAGAYSPQRYSDTTYTSTIGPDFNRFTGADAFFTVNQGGNYAPDYAIYRFGRGVGNPVLTFTAAGTTAALEFARYGDTTDSADEYWALDNVEVASVSASVPDAGASLLLLGIGVAGLIFWRKSCETANPSQP